MVELFSQLLKALLFHWETLISEFHPSFCSSHHIECKLEGASVMHGWVICLLFSHKLWAVSISFSSTFIAWLYSTVLQVMKQVWCFQLLVETFFLYVLQCTLQNMEGTKEMDEVCYFFHKIVIGGWCGLLAVRHAWACVVKVCAREQIHGVPI